MLNEQDLRLMLDKLDQSLERASGFSAPAQNACKAFSFACAAVLYLNNTDLPIVGILREPRHWVFEALFILSAVVLSYFGTLAARIQRYRKQRAYLMSYLKQNPLLAINSPTALLEIFERAQKHSINLTSD